MRRLRTRLSRGCAHSLRPPRLPAPRPRSACNAELNEGQSTRWETSRCGPARWELPWGQRSPAHRQEITPRTNTTAEIKEMSSSKHSPLWKGTDRKSRIERVMLRGLKEFGCLVRVTKTVTGGDIGPRLCLGERIGRKKN